MNQTMKGYICGLAAAVTYGMNPLFGLHLYREGMTPGSVLFYRFFFASILLGGWMLIRKKSFRLPKECFKTIPLAGFLLAATCLLWFMSFRIMDSGIAATILFLYPVMVAAMMTLFFHEKLTRAAAGGILLALGGVAVLCQPGAGNVSLQGIIYILLSALTYALYMIAVRESSLKQLPAETLTFYAMVISVPLFLIPVRFGLDLQWIPSLPALGNLLGLAFFPALLSFLLMAIAIQKIGATKTAILGALEPLSAACIGVLVFDEKCSWNLPAGLILIILAVSAVIRRENA